MSNKVILLQQLIAGIKFHDYLKDPKLEIGERLTLVPEPTNPYDENAIKILHGDIFLGYVPRTETHKLHPYLANNTPLETTLVQVTLSGRHCLMFEVAVDELNLITI